MRIISGQYRGLQLADVGAGDPEAHLRPTSDRVRESIFNLLVNGGSRGSGNDPIRGQRVLDLFAGTGALGLEALSRGAVQVAFVDDGTAARALLRRNIEKMRAMGVTDVWRRDATKLGLNRGAGYGLVFLDPPYGKGLGERAMASAMEGGWLAPGAMVVWEESQPPLLPAGLTLLDQRRYGDTLVTLARAPGQPVPPAAAARPAADGPDSPEAP